MIIIPLASSLLVAGQNSQSNGKNRNVGTSHTTYLAAHECPNVPRSCSFRTCGPIRNRCDLHPRSGSSVLRTCLPTMFPLASHRDHLDQNVRPICHPILPSRRPHNVQPIYLCILCCHLVRHIAHPTYEVNVEGFVKYKKIEVGFAP